MNMKILEWEYQNIRKGMQDIKVEFSKDEKLFSSTLFMMANGTGKTTTIELLRAIFSGYQTPQEMRMEWTPEKVRKFAPTSFKADNGQFRVKVAFDKQEYYYFIQFNYTDGTVKFYTTEINTGGKNEGLNYPKSLRHIFSKNFANRFIFDGEQARKVLDNEENEAEEALKYLYRLNEFDKIVFEANDMFKKYQEKQSNRETGSGHSTKMLITKLKKAEEDYDNICKAEGILKTKQSEFEKEKRETQEKIDKLTHNDNTIQEKYNILNGQLSQTRAEIDNKIKIIIEYSRTPSNINDNICVRLNGLGQNMESLKLPRTIGKQFFIDLASQDNCICDRPIGERERETILHNAKNYLGEKELVILNEIRGRLLNCVRNTDLEMAVTELEELCDKERELRQDIETLQDKSTNKAEIKELKRISENATRELALIKDKLDQITSRDGNASKSRAKREKEELETKLSRALGTLEFSVQIKKLNNYITGVKNLAMKKLKQEVIEKTNKKIAQVITDEKIEIEKIDKSLILRGKSGASEGQTLGIAYCYIGALFEDSEMKLPFIVDSPAGSMDLDKRKEVAQIIPKIFDQLIMFVTSAEVQAFADQFYKLKNIQYITLETDKQTNICKKPNYDREYFDKYQRENRNEKE